MKRYRGKIIIAVICMGMSLCGCDRQVQKITKVDTAMGTIIQETLYAEDIKAGQEAAKEIITNIERLEQDCLSWRMEDAEVAILNSRAGAPEGVILSEALQTDLQQIWEVSRASEGALDITVGQITKLWDLDSWVMENAEVQKEFEVPAQATLQELLKHTGYEKVTLTWETIYLPEDMSLDLGAVGKGIACDRISDYLAEEEKVKGAVISVGGSIMTYGSKPDGGNWNVAVVHPRKEGAYLGTLSLAGEWYVSTSGDYERYVEKDGSRYHHIMDPKTGYPANSGVCSVTILSDSGLLSDALSTACFVLGAEEGLTLAETFGAEALFVTEEMKLVMTEGMKHYFVQKQE